MLLLAVGGSYRCGELRFVFVRVAFKDLSLGRWRFGFNEIARFHILPNIVCDSGEAARDARGQ